LEIVKKKEVNIHSTDDGKLEDFHEVKLKFQRNMNKVIKYV